MCAVAVAVSTPAPGLRLTVAEWPVVAPCMRQQCIQGTLKSQETAGRSIKHNGNYTTADSLQHTNSQASSVRTVWTCSQGFRLHAGSAAGGCRSLCAQVQGDALRACGLLHRRRHVAVQALQSGKASLHAVGQRAGRRSNASGKRTGLAERQAFRGHGRGCPRGFNHVQVDEQAQPTKRTCASTPAFSPMAFALCDNVSPTWRSWSVWLMVADPLREAREVRLGSGASPPSRTCGDHLAVANEHWGANVHRTY